MVAQRELTERRRTIAAGASSLAVGCLGGDGDANDERSDRRRPKR